MFKFVIGLFSVTVCVIGFFQYNLNLKIKECSGIRKGLETDVKACLAKSSSWQDSLDSATSNLEAALREKQECRGKLQIHEETSATKEQSIQELKQKLDLATANHKKELDTVTVETQKLKESLTAKDNEKNAAIQQLQQQLTGETEKLKADLAHANNVIATKNQEIANIQKAAGDKTGAEIEKLKADLAQANNVIATKNQEIANIQKSASDKSSAEVEKLKADLVAWQNSVGAKDNEINNLKATLGKKEQELVGAVQKQQTDVGNLNAEIEKLRAALGEKDALIQRQSNEIIQKNNQITQLSAPKPGP